jgi:hypothetical protein
MTTRWKGGLALFHRGTSTPRSTRLFTCCTPVSARWRGSGIHPAPARGPRACRAPGSGHSRRHTLDDVAADRFLRSLWASAAPPVGLLGPPVIHIRPDRVSVRLASLQGTLDVDASRQDPVHDIK